jgi:protein farnesyltransferase/geranylgeranyltransferase type-1 subunit alpha
MEYSLEVMNTNQMMPVSQRPEWADLTPLPPPPITDPVASPIIDPLTVEVLAYFWAGVKREEKSPRMLGLSEEIILQHNSAQYTVWHWRWRCLEALGGVAADLALDAEEAALMRRVATDNPKNYQLWNHRRKYAMAKGAEHAATELEFAAQCLTVDAKNYHAWAHRQAIITAFGGSLWQQELEYTENLLQQDPRNNTAWNQRAFVLAAAPDYLLPFASRQATYTQEISFVLRHLRRTPHNEAAWVHLEGMARADRTAALGDALATDVRVRDACIDALKEDASNVYALSLLAEVYAAKVNVLRRPGCVSGSAESRDTSKAAMQRAASLACDLWDKLCVADPIRTLFWQYRKRQVRSDWEKQGSLRR